MIHDKCGVVVAHSLHDVYNGMKGLQHRGQETAGVGGNEGTIVKWFSVVEDFFLGI